MDSDFSPTDFVISPREEAWIERLPDGDYLLRWRTPAERVAIYVSDDPDMTAGQRPPTATRFELVTRNSALVTPLAIGRRRSLMPGLTSC